MSRQRCPCDCQQVLKHDLQSRKDCRTRFKCASVRVSKFKTVFDKGYTSERFSRNLLLEDSTIMNCIANLDVHFVEKILRRKGDKLLNGWDLIIRTSISIFFFRSWKQINLASFIRGGNFFDDEMSIVAR